MATIAIVDDNLSSCQILARLLHKAGHAALFILGGDGALEALARMSPDLVILDVNMQDITGLDVLRMLRTHPTLRDLRVVMLSGNRELEIQAEACRLGALDYIVKGLDWESLLARLELHLPRKTMVS